ECDRLIQTLQCDQTTRVSGIGYRDECRAVVCSLDLTSLECDAQVVETCCVKSRGRLTKHSERLVDVPGGRPIEDDFVHRGVEPQHVARPCAGIHACANA